MTGIEEGRGVSVLGLHDGFFDFFEFEHGLIIKYIIWRLICLFCRLLFFCIKSDRMMAFVNCTQVDCTYDFAEETVSFIE